MMKTNIANLIAKIVDKSGDSFEPKMYSQLDNDILVALLKFVVQHENTFHTFTRSVLLKEMEIGSLGSFSPLFQRVFVNQDLVVGLSKKLSLSIGDKCLSLLVDTMLHEHRHCYQREHKLPMTKVRYAKANVDYEAYRNHPMEVDAREKASEFSDEALAYVYDYLSRKYKESTI